MAASIEEASYRLFLYIDRLRKQPFVEYQPGLIALFVGMRHDPAWASFVADPLMQIVFPGIERDYEDALHGPYSWETGRWVSRELRYQCTGATGLCFVVAAKTPCSLPALRQFSSSLQRFVDSNPTFGLAA